jgi:hypothetical protein
MYRLLFVVTILLVLDSSLASAKDLGKVIFHETESAYFFEQKVANRATTVFYQPKLTTIWKQIASLDGGNLWQVNVNFRGDIDFNDVKAALPVWKEKIFVRASIDAAKDCRFTPDLPGRFKAKLKNSTAGKTFSGLHLCQFEVLTKLGDTEIVTKLRDMTTAGTLFVSGLEGLTLTALEPEMPVSVDALHQYLLPYSARLRALDQTTAQFTLILAIGGIKSELLLSLVEKVDAELIFDLQNRIFAKSAAGYDLRNSVEDEVQYLGFRTLSKVIHL